MSELHSAIGFLNNEALELQLMHVILSMENIFNIVNENMFWIGFCQGIVIRFSSEAWELISREDDKMYLGYRNIILLVIPTYVLVQIRIIKVWQRCDTASTYHWKKIYWMVTIAG